MILGLASQAQALYLSLSLLLAIFPIPHLPSSKLSTRTPLYTLRHNSQSHLYPHMLQDAPSPSRHCHTTHTSFSSPFNNHISDSCCPSHQPFHTLPSPHSTSHPYITNLDASPSTGTLPTLHAPIPPPAPSVGQTCLLQSV